LSLTLQKARNDSLNVPRADFDRLKATLHNAVRLGWQSQNRDHHPDFRWHLDGRINWVERLNPHRGARLREIFNYIDWKQ
jgi:RNA-directed DNA polymerase